MEAMIDVIKLRGQASCNYDECSSHLKQLMWYRRIFATKLIETSAPEKQQAIIDQIEFINNEIKKLLFL